jgi:prepilin-type N-terminal cleavage/methylation domain-containing protein
VNGRGFTLLELVVATTVLAVGVLAVASTALPVTRLIRWGGAQSAAAEAAAGRIETLRAGGCAALAAGDTLIAGRYRLRWVVDAAGALRRVNVVATYPWADRFHSDTFETSVACVP